MSLDPQELASRLAGITAQLLELSQSLGEALSGAGAMHDDGEPPTPRVRYGEVTGCVLDLINKNAEGLTAQEVKAELERKFGSRIGRRSHATILCRLQSEGKVIRKGRKWLKIRVQSGWKKAADSLSPA